MKTLRQRGPDYLTARSSIILGNQEILETVQKGCSATEVHATILAKTGNADQAKAARCLYFLKEEYLNTYTELLQTRTGGVQ